MSKNTSDLVEISSKDFEKGSIEDEPSNGTLEELGYHATLSREYSMLSVFSFAVSVSGLFATVGTSFIYPLEAGGPACIVWSWLIAGVGALLIAISVAELVSAYPTSGGLYYVCSRVFPEKPSFRGWGPLMAWINGYVSLGGQLACAASSEWGGAQMVLSAASMGSDFSYIPTDRHTVGTVSAILVFHGVINCLPTKYVERLSKLYVFLHYAALLAGAITLLAVTEPKHDASYVFTHVEPTSGWSPTGWSFMFGFLAASWTLTNYDAPAHLCEEMKNPEIKAPWAIAAGNTTTLILGFLYNIVLCFCLGDPKSVIDASLPVAQIYYNQLGKAGGIAFTVLMFVVMNFVGISVVQAASRTMWAQSRDNLFGKHGSRLVAHVNTTTKTPINAVIVSTIVCICVCLIGLGSSETMNAIFNATFIAIDWSACVPIIGKLLNPNLFKRGPWHLGKASTAVNVAAVLWTSYVSIIFVMPNAMPVTKENMNYCVVFFVVLVAVPLIVWFCGGGKEYKGPGTGQEDNIQS